MTNKEEIIASLDRLIISNTDTLEKGKSIVIKTNDGYLIVEKEYDHEHKKFKTSTFFSEFDDCLNYNFKDLLEKKGEMV